MAAAQLYEVRAVVTGGALGLFVRLARARVATPGWDDRRVDVDVAESHRQHRNGGARDDLGEDAREQLSAGGGSIRPPARLLVLILCGAGRRLCSERPGREPGLSCLRWHLCGGPLQADTTSESPAPADRLDRRPRSGDAPCSCPPAPSVPVQRSPYARGRRPARGLMRAPPRTLRRLADRRSGCSGQPAST